MKAHLAIMTGTRAEYGIFRPLLRAFRDRDWRCDLYVTGTHLAPQFGMTVSEIEEDGFAITERIDILLASDTASAVSRSIALAVISFTDLLERHRPDLLFILGDRFEAMAVTLAAHLAGIPVAHLHGGEVTEGAIDDAFRHSITKMASLHFAATGTYRDRIIQLGENPSRVWNVGALGLDNLRELELSDRAELEADLGFTFRARNILVTHHPLTLDLDRSAADIGALITALEQLDDVGILLTAANADTGGAAINMMLSAFAARNSDRVRLVTSLGTRRYFSVLRQVDAVVGNSSSGLIEVPSFGIPTIDVGDRQRGRVAGPSVVNVPGEPDLIRRALEDALSAATRRRLAGVPSPYGEGRTAAKICDVVQRIDFPIRLQKGFYDLPCSVSPRPSAAS